MITHTFDFHVDAKHFNYMWTEAMYIAVQYAAWKEEGKIKYIINSISAPPFFLGSIVLHGNWWTVDVEINAAVLDHAGKEFARNGHVNETIMSALAPHI